ncbi:hypothetical protein CQW23_17612 [Capsicum baccatum]|uniref:HMA domain-containing protein n=1 Tax=Capsicum baccatum TaxID=33114 RepID=A0A2G2WEE2_CAPBA|nr:hypothetical protein CQW23_17612 [Capsicum baccatum]
MTNHLFNLFVTSKSAKEIWDNLEKKRSSDDAGKKKYVVGQWIKFQMDDDKSIMEQVHEYENLTVDVLNEGMKMCEILQANVLLEKKFHHPGVITENQLKHKKKNLNLQELISYMRTEEANCLKVKMEVLSLNSSKANLVESSGTITKDRYEEKQKNVQNKEQVKKKNNFNKPKSQIKKSKGPCFVCEKLGHKAVQCYLRKGQNSKQGGQGDSQAHITEGDEVIAAVIVEANLVANKTDWVLDTGASRKFCANKELFHDFEESTDGECVYMGDSTTAKVIGAISWKSSKQTCIAYSTIKSKFIALELAGQEAEWLRNLLTDVPLWGRQMSPVSLHCDSQAAIEITKNSVYNGRDIFASDMMTEMRVHMDCAGCESKVRKSLEKVKGVDNVEIDMAMQKVTVTGWADQKKILKTVRRTGKRAEIWQFPHNPAMRNNNPNLVTDYYYQQQGCGGPPTYYCGEPPASAYNYRKHGYDNYGRAYSLYRGNSNTFGSRAGDAFSDENPHGCKIM